MSTIKATLDVQPDGTLHLPVPPEVPRGKVHVEATLVSAEPALNAPAAKKATPGLWQSLPGPFWISPDFDEPLDDFQEYME